MISIVIHTVHKIMNTYFYTSELKWNWAYLLYLKKQKRKDGAHRCNGQMCLRNYSNIVNNLYLMDIKTIWVIKLNTRLKSYPLMDLLDIDFDDGIQHVISNVVC